MSTNPNTVKSQDDINEGGRKSDVLLSTIDKVIELEEWQKDMRAKYGNMSEKCERLQKQLEIAIEGLKKYESGSYIFSDNNGISTGSMKLAADDGRTARKYLQQIEELN